MWNCVSVSLTDMVVGPYRVSRWLAESVESSGRESGPDRWVHITSVIQCVRTHSPFVRTVNFNKLKS